MSTDTVTGNANVNHCTAYTKCLSWLEHQYDKGSSFLDISKVRARVCVCAGGWEGGGSIPYATGRKASQCYIHADTKSVGLN